MQLRTTHKNGSDSTYYLFPPRERPSIAPPSRFGDGIRKSPAVQYAIQNSICVRHNRIIPEEEMRTFKRCRLCLADACQVE